MACDRRERHGVPQPVHRERKITFPDNTQPGSSRREVGEGSWRQAGLPVRGLLHRTRRRRTATSRGPISAPATAPWEPVCSRSRSRVTAIAILCPQNLDYLSRLLRRAVCRPDRGAAVRSVRAGSRRPSARRARRLRPLDDPDHHRRGRRRAQVLPRPLGQGAPPRHRRRRGARRGRRHLAGSPRSTRHHRLPAVHLRFHPHPDGRADHPSEPAHQRGPGARSRWRATKATAGVTGCRSSTTWA